MAPTSELLEPSKSEIALPTDATSWQADIIYEVRQIQDVLEGHEVPMKRATPVHEHLADAVEIVSRRAGIRSLLTGVHIEAAWRSIHAARQALLVAAPDDYARSQMPILRSKVTRYIPKRNPERASYLAWLSKAEKSRAGSDTAQLRAIREAVDRESDLKFTNIRRFRNTIRSLIVGVTALLVVLALDPPDRPWLPICAPAADEASSAGGSSDEETPEAAPSPDAGEETTEPSENGGAAAESCPLVWHLVLVGMVGGFLAGPGTLRRLPSIREPYGLRREQAFLKIPVGGLTAIVGTLFLQSGLVDALEPQPAPEILAYAVIFGFGQNAVMRFMDQKAEDLLAAGESPTAEEPDNANP